MKYLATFDPHGIDLAEWFDDQISAEEWLDSRNNNAEYKTVIDFYDEEGNFIDGFIYTA